MDNNGYVMINGQWVKKPTKGKCAYCGSDMLEFYDDGTGICLNCGRTFSWLKPLQGPVNPQAAQQTRSPPRPAQNYASPGAPQHQQTAPAPTYSPPTPQPSRKRSPTKRMPTSPDKNIYGAPTVENAQVEGPGFLSPKAISILGFIGALFLGIGVLVWIASLPMGSWPKYEDSELIGNLRKVALLIWSIGTMLFLMAGFAAAGTREMNYRVRATLVASSVALAILSFSLWLGMAMMSGGFGYP